MSSGWPELQFCNDHLTSYTGPKPLLLHRHLGQVSIEKGEVKEWKAGLKKAREVNDRTSSLNFNSQYDITLDLTSFLKDSLDIGLASSSRGWGKS